MTSAHLPSNDSTESNSPGSVSVGVLVAYSVLVAVLVGGAYFPVTDAGFVWDDDKYVTNNPLLTSDDALFRIWFSKDHPSQYFPLVYTSFLLEKALWGFAPLGYHLTNLVLHGLNAILLFVILTRLRLFGAWLAALLFVVHPVHVESVAWVTERKNVLSLFLTILSALAWLRASDENRGQKARAWLGFSLFLYVGALTAKTTACTFPAALVLMDWIRGRGLDRRRWAQISIYVVLGLAIGLFTLWWEHEKQGLHPEAGDLSFPQRGLIAARAVCFYLGKLVWPSDLMFSYPKWDVETDVGWHIASVGLIVVLTCVFFLCRRRGTRFPLYALIFFVAMLSPVLGFISLYTFFYTYVADHYQYVASIGPLALMAAAVMKATSWMGSPGRPILGLIATGWIVGLGAMTYRQCKVYESPITLWQDVLDKNPSSWLAHTNLGTTYQGMGEIDRATELFRLALKIKPEHGQLHFNLGASLQMSGKNREAIVFLRSAIRLEPDDPDAYNNLGLALQSSGRSAEAVEVFRAALTIRPGYAEARNNLGGALLSLGRSRAAVRQFELALETKPKLADAHANLGATLFELGRLDPARAHLKEAVRLNDSMSGAHVNLSALLLRIGEFDEALVHARRAVELRTNWPIGLTHLAWILAADPDANESELGEALKAAQLSAELTGEREIRPLDVLGMAHAAMGDFARAVQVATKASILASEADDLRLVAEIGERIRGYRDGQAFRRPPGPRD